MIVAVKHLEIRSGGSGDFVLSGSADEFNYSGAGSGDVTAKDLSAQNCKVSTAGSGDVVLKKGTSAKVSSVGGMFDHIVSLGMFEHVGYKNYRSYMNVAQRCLKDDGLFLLHTIGSNTSSVFTDPWINKYIFPDSMIPSVKQIARAIEGIFVMEDWHNFSADYDKTLMAWHDNFTTNWNEIKNDYDEKFFRMWKYYLSCVQAYSAPEKIMCGK